MKILQISSASSFGGGERYLVDLANTLSARGHEVYAALRPNSPVATALRLPPHQLKTLTLRNALDAPSAQALSSLVKQKQIDVVHAHIARDYSLAAYAARCNPSTRFFVTRHVLFRLNRFHRRTLSQAARVIAVSSAVGRHLQEQNLVPSERIVVIPNGVDFARLNRARAALDRNSFFAKLRIPNDSQLIGSLGELRTLKRHDDFIKAAAIVAKQFPQARFIVAGVDTSQSGEVRQQLKHMVHELDLRDRVQLLGWLDDVAELLCGLDIFVSASETESFGLAIAESMAVERPVVATATEGASELIQNQISGLLVPIGDVERMAEAIAFLLRDQNAARELGKRARTTIEDNFSLERMVDEIEKVYVS